MSRKSLTDLSEGQYFVMIFRALVAEGVNLVMKASLFFISDMAFGLRARYLLLNLTQLVY